jgi:hypothetical protein
MLAGAFMFVPVAWLMAPLAVRLHPAALRKEILATARFEYLGDAIFCLFAWAIVAFLPEGTGGKNALFGILSSALVASSGWGFWQSSEELRRYWLPESWVDRFGYERGCYGVLGLYLAMATVAFFVGWFDPMRTFS